MCYFHFFTDTKLSTLYRVSADQTGGIFMMKLTKLIYENPTGLINRNSIKSGHIHAGSLTTQNFNQIFTYILKYNSIAVFT